MKILKAGIVIRTLTRNTAPGRIFKVAMYTLEYSGAKIIGIIVSATPNSEYTLPVIYE